jgi:hypothetical protein
MKAIECRLPQEIDKSFIVFEEKGNFFHYPWHYHPEYELVLITKSTGPTNGWRSYWLFPGGRPGLYGTCITACLGE